MVTVLLANSFTVLHTRIESVAVSRSTIFFSKGILISRFAICSIKEALCSAVSLIFIVEYACAKSSKNSFISSVPCLSSFIVRPQAKKHGLGNQIEGFLKVLPYLSIPISYVFFRLIFYFYPINFHKSISLILTLLITSFVLIILLKKKTNKFKTNIDMDSLLKLGKGQRDESRRIIRK